MSFYNRFRAGGNLGSSSSSSSSSSSYMSGFQKGGNLGNGGEGEQKKTESPAPTQTDGGSKKEAHSISNSMSYLEVIQFVVR